MALSDAQVRSLLCRVRNPIHKCCLMVMYACGLRIGEAVTLEVSSVDKANQLLRVIMSCRTAALGGHLWRCDQCSHEIFSYHSCKNRSCPKCHTKQTEQWLEARKAELLPTDYFHVTVTVPQELRALMHANQRDGYSLLMKAAAESIVELARDKRYVGGTPACSPSSIPGRSNSSGILTQDTRHYHLLDFQ